MKKKLRELRRKREFVNIMKQKLKLNQRKEMVKIE